MSEPIDPVEKQATFLPTMLAVIAGGFFCIVMVLITGGFFFYIVAAILGMVLLGMFHYMVWGRAMDQEVAAERKHLEELDEVKEKFTRGTTWTYRR